MHPQQIHLQPSCLPAPRRLVQSFRGPSTQKPHSPAHPPIDLLPHQAGVPEYICPLTPLTSHLQASTCSTCQQIYDTPYCLAISPPAAPAKGPPATLPPASPVWPCEGDSPSADSSSSDSSHSSGTRSSSARAPSFCSQRSTYSVQALLLAGSEQLQELSHSSGPSASAS